MARTKQAQGTRNACQVNNNNSLIDICQAHMCTIERTTRKVTYNCSQTHNISECDWIVRETQLEPAIFEHNLKESRG